MKNTHANWMGMLTFAFCMVVTTVFFFATLFLEPGPIDNQANVAPGLSKKADIERKHKWAEPSQDSVARGEQSYNTNCAFCHNSSGQNEILNRFKSGQTKYGKTQLDIFKVISKGLPEKGMYRLDHLMENERWDLVHYLRSLNPSLPTSSKSDMEKYYNNRLFSEGI